MKKKEPLFFARAIGEAYADLSQKTNQNRDLWKSRKKRHRVACYKCGKVKSVTLGRLSASHASYSKFGTEHQGNHFCCSNCVKSGLDEVRQARINTASDAKLKEAIKILRKAGKMKAAELLESKLNSKEVAK